MSHFLRSLAVSTITLWLMSTFLVNVSFLDYTSLGLAALALTLALVVVRPVVKLFLLPINVITLGIFGWVINAALLWLVLYLVPGFTIQPVIILGVPFTQFWTVVIFSWIISFGYSLIHIFI